ncbi:hypothetical protein ACTTAI_17290 [Rhodobacter capsulatus]|uniref:hypothetical protein n=1 Tax=Rhodobacter capsulatus TaxID=1061 RepID=UPI004028EDF9
MSDALSWQQLAYDVVKLVIAAGVGVVIAHYLRQKEDAAKRRSEWVTKRLEEAYLLVVEAIEYPGMPAEEGFQRKLKLEKAINTLELYADQTVLEKAKKISEGYAKKEDWIVYDDLLTELRDSLRKTYGLTKITEPVIKITFVKPGVTDVKDGAQ